MTTIERPYWPHSNPEPPQGPVSAQPAFTATPPQNCLNGCERPSGDVREPVLCQPGHVLCKECEKRLDKWLRGIPDAFGRLLWVKDHGTVPADPGTMHTKRPDPPAPGRLEVTDLLDDRPIWTRDDNGVPIRTENRRGVLGIVHDWARRIREERDLPIPRCHCGHSRPTHTGRCSAIGCACRGYVPGPFYVYAECQLIRSNLAWCTQQEFAGDLYSEIKQLARTLDDTVGEYRPKPVGSCAALRDVPDTTVQVLCGGALVMDREGTGVHCLRCGSRHEANEQLRALGLIVGAMFGENRIDQEAS